MATSIRKQLERAFREQTEYFANDVKPQLDSLDKSILPHERMERISPPVREKYEAMCHRIDELKQQGVEKLDAVLSTNEALLLEMVPLMTEICRLERELGLLLPGVADLRPDGTCCPITDSYTARLAASRSLFPERRPQIKVASLYLRRGTSSVSSASRAMAFSSLVSGSPYIKRKAVS